MTMYSVARLHKSEDDEGEHDYCGVFWWYRLMCFVVCKKKSVTSVLLS